MGLFDAEFDIVIPQHDIKNLTNKIIASQQNNDDIKNTEKVLKSKNISLLDRLSIISSRVLNILGKQKKNVLVIRDKDTLNEYTENIINSGLISIDTETNNSLDPITCKLMGLCLYYPGGKQAYIPLNHRDPETKELLPNQLTEEDCRLALQKVKDAKTFVIMHNGKFDYEVIKCTCNIEIPPDWDTIIAARLLDENEFSRKQSSLKYIYTKYIDPSQKKYDIESLFENIPYAFVAPEIFALYAATDSFMTYKIFELQKKQLEQPENSRLYWVFTNIEMPIVQVTAEIELTGVCIDINFGARLKEKYNMLLTDLDFKISRELLRAKTIISEWRKTDVARAASIQWQPKKTKKTLAEIEAAYPEVDKATGKRFKRGKPLSAQIPDPVDFGEEGGINMASPTQLAILFYDILGCKVVSKKAPRGTGEEELTAIADDLRSKIEKRNQSKKDLSGQDLNNDIIFNLCDLILERRGLAKLITTYIDVIPALAQHWPDKRIRFHLNSMGTDTGRYSSGGTIKWMDEETMTPIEVSGINSQNIPSRGDGKITRLLFKAQEKQEVLPIPENRIYEIPEITEVETVDGFKYCKDLKIGDKLIISDSVVPIIDIQYNSNVYYIKI